MLGDRIKRARIAAGLSQRRAAELVGLSAMAISKFERGTLTPNSKTLIALGRAFRVRVEYFFRSSSPAIQGIRYRKEPSLPKKILAKIEAIVIDHVERFLETLTLYPISPIESFQVPRRLPEVHDLDDVESVALKVRKAWRLGQDPIASVVGVLEEHGILVVIIEVPEGARFDGLAATADGTPIIVVGREWPGDRQRFTLAHELGHLVLDGRLPPGLDEEQACNRFAGAFLVPRERACAALGPHRTQLGSQELLLLKHEYGLSMAGWVHRAHELGIISHSLSTSIFKSFNELGWRTEEPGDPFPQEVSRLHEQLVQRALAENMISTAKAAELLGISTREMREQNPWEVVGAAAHQ